MRKEKNKSKAYNKSAENPQYSGTQHNLFEKILSRPWTVSSALGIVTFAVYYQTIFYQLTGCDDMLMISNAASLMKQGSSILNAFVKPYMFDSGLFYRPVVIISLCADLLVGNSPSVFHVFNIIYFSTATLLFYYTLQIFEVKRTTAFLAACIFSVHPLFANTVAWIPGRNDSLLTIFSLAAFLTAIGYINTKKIQYIVLSGLFLMIALFTKETAFAFAVFVIFYLIYAKKSASFSTRIKIILTYALSLAAWYIARNAAVSQQAAFAPFRNSGFVVQAIGKFFLPFNISVLPTLAGTVYIAGAIGAAILIMLTVFSAGQYRTTMIAGILWFVICIIPSVVNINPEYSSDFMLECRLTLPVIGLFIAICSSGLLKKLQNHVIGSIIFSAIFIPLIVLTVSFSNSYSNEEVFWRSAVETSPDLDLSYAGLGLTYLHKELWHESEVNYIKAIELNPGKIGYHGKAAYVMLKQNNADGALQYFLNEVALNPGDYESNLLAGIILYKKGNYIESERRLLEAAKINATDFQPLFYLMKLYYDNRNYSEAFKYAGNLKAKGIKIPDDIAKAIGLN